jgi:hypothetical protein
LWTICLGWPQTVILLISASQTAKLTGSVIFQKEESLNDNLKRRDLNSDQDNDLTFQAWFSLLNMQKKRASQCSLELNVTLWGRRDRKCLGLGERRKRAPGA